MTTATSDFQRLIAEMARGSEEAAWELVETYSPHIMRSVRASLPRAIRPKIDSQDFVQAVWASMILKRGQLDQFHSPEQFIGYLAAVARNKVIDSHRHYLNTQAYNVRREVSIPTLQHRVLKEKIIAPTEKHIAAADQQLPKSRDPTPSHVAVAREAWQRVVGKSSIRDQQVVSLRIEGHTYNDIAKQLSIGEKTVRRVLIRIVDELQE